MQVFFDRLTTLLQVQLQNYKFFFCHDTITVVVVCTMAAAKVLQNYNCYNVHFNGCLLILQIAVDVLVKSGYTVVQLVQREVPILGVDSLELAAVNRNKTLVEQVLAKAETVEFLECLLDGLLVVLAEVGYCAEVRSKLTQKPHHLDVYQALPGKLAR